MHQRFLRRHVPFALAIAVVVGACTTQRIPPRDHEHQASPAGAAASYSVAQTAGLPAGAVAVSQRLSTSPRHGEWVMIRSGTNDSVRAWIEYPERSTKAPVVVVIHEIFGLSTWVRGVADQLAADGYIAIAPDLLTGKGELQGDTRRHIGDSKPQAGGCSAANRGRWPLRNVTSSRTAEVWRGRFLLGRWNVFRPCRYRASQSRRGRRLLRYFARNCATGQCSGAGARTLWRQRRSRRCNDTTG